jgi:hypothetical protein
MRTTGWRVIHKLGVVIYNPDRTGLRAHGNRRVIYITSTGRCEDILLRVLIRCAGRTELVCKLDQCRKGVRLHLSHYLLTMDLDGIVFWTSMPPNLDILRSRMRQAQESLRPRPRKFCPDVKSRTLAADPWFRRQRLSEASLIVRDIDKLIRRFHECLYGTWIFHISQGKNAA